ncbi:MAG: MarR family transcriptional regulator [Chloroflexota bacterium]
MKEVWSDRERVTWLSFIRTFGTVNQQLCADMEQVNQLPMPWYDVLVTLYQYAAEEGLSMQQLADNIMMSTSGLTRLVDRMIDGGLIQRKRAKDRRIVHVFLTDAGREKLEAVLPYHQQRVHQYFLQHLSEDEMDAIQHMGDRIQQYFKGDDKDHG